MSEAESLVKEIGDIERKISDGEALLRGVARAREVGWFFMVVGLLMIGGNFGDFFVLIGTLVIALSVWRLYTAAKNTKEIEDGLREYRGRKAELQAKLLIH
jgi:hypothetical protein